jgi:hypothetical protein
MRKGKVEWGRVENMSLKQVEFTIRYFSCHILLNVRYSNMQHNGTLELILKTFSLRESFLDLYPYRHGLANTVFPLTSSLILVA